MPDQLVFNWPADEGLKAEDFFVSDANAQAVTLLRAPETWPELKLVLVGPEGSGKSHLARIFQDERHAKIFTSADIPRNYSAPYPVVIEDADSIPESEEEALVHLHNNLRAAGLPLLLTARLTPSRWALALPDLKSRMVATTVAQIEDPDDELLHILLAKLFADRQVMPPPSVINYVATRMDRSYVAAREIVEQLDRVALADKKQINIKMAAALLDI